MTVPLLPPDQLAELADLVADRLLERLGDRAPSSDDGPQLVDADTLARMFGISRSTVYEHAAEFGAVQLGDSPKALVRFDVDQARAAWTSRDTSKQSQAPDPPAAVGDVRRRRRRAARSDDGLLPVGGHAA